MKNCVAGNASSLTPRYPFKPLQPDFDLLLLANQARRSGLAPLERILILDTLKLANVLRPPKLDNLKLGVSGMDGWGVLSHLQADSHSTAEPRLLGWPQQTLYIAKPMPICLQQLPPPL